jgi:hypothetical protein
MKAKLGTNNIINHHNLNLRNFNDNYKMSSNDNNIFQNQKYKISTFDKYNNNISNQYQKLNYRTNKFNINSKSKSKSPIVNNNYIKKNSVNNSYDRVNSKNRFNNNINYNK